ncbi:MAG: hypothetical protein WCK55_13465, partial [Verrucomicrobiota bacterium]
AGTAAPAGPAGHGALGAPRGAPAETPKPDDPAFAADEAKKPEEAKKPDEGKKKAEEGKKEEKKN